MKNGKLTEAQSAYLDIVRALAAMTVLVGHAAMIFLSPTRLGNMNVQAGGVLVFFLLSGFLISYSVFKKHGEAGYKFSDYFIDRFARIYCAYLPALFFVAIVDSMTLKLWPLQVSPQRPAPLQEWLETIPATHIAPTWLGNAFMLQDFPLFQIARRIGIPDNSWFFKSFGSGKPFWTISVEWWLYMVFGVVVLKHIKERKPWTVVGVMVLGAVAIEPLYYVIGGYDNCLGLLWLIGMAVSLLFVHLPKWQAGKAWRVTEGRWRIYCLAACALSVFFMFGRIVAIHLEDKGGSFVELQFALFLAVALFSVLFALGTVEKVPRPLARAASFVAGYSYSLYLIHMTLLVYIYLRYPGHDNDPRFFWYGIAVSNIAAIIFWWLFERHYRKLAVLMKGIWNRRLLTVRSV